MIVRTESRTYIGKVLDMYKKGSSVRYGSVTKLSNLVELQALSLLVYLPLTLVWICVLLIVYVTDATFM